MITQILRNLTRRKMRTALTVSGISIGVAMVVAMGAIGGGMRTGYVSLLSGSQSDLIMMQKGSGDVALSAVDQDVVGQIAAMHEIESVNGLVVANVTVPGTPFFFVFGYDPKGFAIKRFKVSEGQALSVARQTAVGPGEMLLGKQAADTLKLKLGDTLRLPGKSFRVVGIYTTGNGFEDASAVVSLTDAQQLTQKPREVSAIQVKLKDVRQIDSVRAKLQRLYPKLAISQSSQAANEQATVTSIEAFAMGIAFLAIVIGGVGMTNTVMMSALERTREIGTLRAMGWSRMRVLAMVLGESVALGVLGAILGCAIGAILIGLMGQSAMLSFLRGQVTVPLLIQGIVMAIVLGGVGGIYPAWWASRLLPIEALRYEGGTGAGSKSKLSNLRFQIGRFGSDTLKSLWRRRGRTLLTVIGLSIGIAAVVALNSIADALPNQLTRIFASNGIDLVAKQKGASDLPFSALSEQLGKQIAALPGVESVSGIIYGTVNLDSGVSMIIWSYDPQESAIRRFRIVEGRGLLGSREIIVGRPAIEVLKTRVGDMVRLGEVGFRVVGIFETGVGWEEAGVVMSLRDGQAFLNKPRQVSLYGIKVKNPQQAQAIGKQIEDLFPDVTASLSSEVNEIMPQVNMMYALVAAIGLLAILVGGIGMMNTMIMSMFERTREIGTLRALGWQRRRVLVMVFKEAIALSVIGAIVGTTLAVSLDLLIQQVPTVGTMMQITYSPSMLGKALIVALVLGTVGGLYPAWRAANLKPVEALRYE